MATSNYDRSQKRIDQARSKAARAINLAPRSVEARLAQARFLVYQGGALAPQAEPLLPALKAEEPHNARVIECLSALWDRQGRTAESEQLSEVRGKPNARSLERSYAITAADLRLNPAWDQVRALPRFQTLQASLDTDPGFLATMGQPQTAAIVSRARRHSGHNPMGDEGP